MSNKCTAKMKLTHTYRIRLTEQQFGQIEELKKHGVVLSKFIRSAINEKIQRERIEIYKRLSKEKLNKERKEYCPF